MLTLREFRASDIDDMMEWAMDDAVTEFLVWETYTSRDAAVEFFHAFIVPHPWFRAICWADVAIGSLSLTPGSGIHACRAELGYVLARRYWGRGIMTAAVTAAVEQGFRELQSIARIEAIVFRENAASQRVLIKAGFASTGLQRSYVIVKNKLRDCYVFEMVREESSSLGSSLGHDMEEEGEAIELEDR
ncbi:hypothetical protein SELMODRAFT_131939 [Selaginella moellendorffii]|uniref:N-acetyltransferase domain-containing protein n=1 Tax=Selaginella moellendorffii TaxID=88036 RepID=D8T4U5_SELML|nr:uncharacterized protein LOC9662871 [Selaginella moellendorffii]EFJ08235.1 hypothetical protein SELMODRAFT_131939 [Selaginella moellendorffii]|eukprot:XP_002990603.1 uncharacterized protein LOC9662871 [Selaginella moellendorffii]